MRLSLSYCYPVVVQLKISGTYVCGVAGRAKESDIHPGLSVVAATNGVGALDLQSSRWA